MSDEDADDFIPDIESQIEDNTSERTPCILVLDCSSSMREDGRIEALNQGLRAFEQDLKNDPIARRRVTVMVITFGGSGEVKIEHEWTDAAYFEAPTLEANGNTPMGSAMAQALKELEDVKGVFRENGVTWSRPWIFLMTDGEPNDRGWENVAAEVARAVDAKRCVIYPIAVPGARHDVLQRFAGSEAEILEADRADFQSLFKWLSASLSKQASMPIGDALQTEYQGHMLTHGTESA